MGNVNGTLAEITKIGNYAIPAFGAFLTATLAGIILKISSKWTSNCSEFCTIYGGISLGKLYPSNFLPSISARSTK
jgi:hypothetical protein